MRSVISENAPKGYQSAGVISGNTLYISGQTSADPTTGKPAEGGFAQEMTMALLKMESVLKAAGCAREDVLMCQVYIADMSLWESANQVYAEFFGSHKPARIVLPVPPLSNGCQVELTAIAEVK